MAHANFQTVDNSRDVLIKWDQIRNIWISCAFKISKVTGANVKTFFNTFVASNPRFSFTIAKMFDELIYVCVTTDQYLDIKLKLENTFKLDLPEIHKPEVFPGGEREERTFRNTNEFRQFREQRLFEKNKPIIQAKHDEARDHFMKLQAAFNTQDQKDFMAFDTEMYEHDHTILLEICYVVVRLSPSRFCTRDNLPKVEVTRRVHLIIEENLEFRNKDHVPDNRNGFTPFGVSETLHFADAVERFRQDIAGCDYIFGHSVKHDEAYLKSIGVDLSKLGKQIFDTQMVDAYKESLKDNKKFFTRGLSFLLKHHELNFQEIHLHNAGCDAFYTMMLFLRQMGYTAQKVNAIIAS